MPDGAPAGGAAGLGATGAAAGGEPAGAAGLTGAPGPAGTGWAGRGGGVEAAAGGVPSGLGARGLLGLSAPSSALPPNSLPKKLSLIA